MNASPREAHEDTTDPQRQAPRLVETWPPGVSTRASMRISDVLAALQPEFPALSHSKLRFLEEQGLVEPVRTPAGYRQYSPAHVERLRYVLGEQRDRYLPLKVIKEKLAELDAGLNEAPVAAPRLAPSQDGGGVLHAAGSMTAAALADEASVSEDLVIELVEAGILQADSRGRLDVWSRQVVVHAAALREHGIGPRHLRSLRTAVDRDLGLVEQVVAPARAQGTPSSRARAEATAVELGEELIGLHAAMVRQSVARLDV